MQTNSLLWRVVSGAIVSMGLVACGQQTASSSAGASVVATSVATVPQVAFTAEQIAPIQIDYTPLTQVKTYYFDNKGHLVDKATEQGYYRQIVGQTADGRVVAQDFFQDTQKPQTSLFIITKNLDERNFSQSILDSRIMWYDRKDGSVISVAEFKEGKQQGWLDVYEYNRLIFQMRDRDVGLGFVMRYFSEDDKTWGEAQFHTSQNGQTRLESLTFYHPNGQILTELKTDAKAMPQAVATYNDQGQTVSAEQNQALNETLMRRFMVLWQKMPMLLAR